VNDSRPDSSVSHEERPVSNREAAGSTPARGSNSWLYVVVRKELSGGALLAQVAHAAREASAGPAPADERACILSATKEQLVELVADLLVADIPHRAIVETDGPLTGSTTAIGLVTVERDRLKQLTRIGELRPWRKEGP
jgi:hypothetical protein